MRFLGLLIFLFAINAQAQLPTQPTQPKSGPGGSDYKHESVKIIKQGHQAGDFILYIPLSPEPDSANVIAFFHGILQTNPIVVGEWIEHLVRKGNIVIFARYHKNELFPFERDYLANGARAVKRALNYLDDHPELVQPRKQNFAIFGHSFGGTMVTTYAAKFRQYGLLKPKAVFACQGGDIPWIALPNYKNIDYDTKMLTIAGVNDPLGTSFGYRVFNTSGANPDYNNLIIHMNDHRGVPSITSGHDAPLCIMDKYNSGDNSFYVGAAYALSSLDAVDFYGYWKLFDGLLDCTFEGKNCDYAFGDTPEQRNLGTWSDGVPIRPLKIILKKQKADSERMIVDNQGFAEKKKVDIYPNPVVGSDLFIQINSLEEYLDNVSIELLSIDGRSVFQKTPIVVNPKLFYLNLNNETISPGIYLLTISDSKGQKIDAQQVIF